MKELINYTQKKHFKGVCHKCLSTQRFYLPYEWLNSPFVCDCGGKVSKIKNLINFKEL